MFILLQDLLNKIWSFMESEPPLNPLLARWETVHSRTAKYITLAINTNFEKAADKLDQSKPVAAHRHDFLSLLNWIFVSQKLQ